MQEFMLSQGKIFVVFAVILTILTGLILYLFSLDRRLKRMEKEEDG